jgi:hypothetical protein
MQPRGTNAWLDGRLKTAIDLAAHLAELCGAGIDAAFEPREQVEHCGIREWKDLGHE